MVSSANAINATLYDKLNFDFIRDIAPIAGINHSTYVLAVHPSFSAKTVPEFIAYARQGDPGGQHQGGVIGATSAKYSVTPATRLW
jgi:tripartite-type tricarboxylate transporter receptor subunit TctC